MVAVPPILRRTEKCQTKIIGGGGGAEQKIKFGEGGKFKGGPRI